MRLLFLTHYFHPEVGAAQTRILDLANELARRGHEVGVLTGFPNYPDGVIQAAYRGRLVHVERLGDIRVTRTAIYPAPNRGVGRRLLNHLSFAVSSFPASAWAGPADVVIVETPPLFTAVAGVIVAALKRARLLLNVADLWPDAAIQLGALRHRPVIAGARALERFAYRHADMIAVPTPGLKRVLLERGYRSDEVIVVPHGVDPARFSPDSDAGVVPQRVVYCGTVGMGHAVGTLIEAARMLEERDGCYDVLIVGDGAERAELEARAREWGLRTVTFAGRVSHAELPELLASAGVAIATQRDLPLLADALSTKVLEYMAAARPVVAAVSGWTAEVIASAGAGIVCPPEQPAPLAEAIAQVMADPDRAQAMGRSGRRYVEAHLTRRVAVEHLEHALALIAGDGSATRHRHRRRRSTDRSISVSPEQPTQRSGDTRCANAIFQQPWWLEALAPGRWGEATVERDGRVVARLPYVVRGRSRLRVLTMPPLTQTLGPWVERSSAKPARALSDEIELLAELEAALPPADVFVQHFSPVMLNALPFYWAGYRLELQYTYRLQGLGSEEVLWDGLRGNIRREIRKARRRVEVRDDLGLDRFYAIWSKTFARQGLAPPASLGDLERLDSACAVRGARSMLFAQDGADRVHAVAYAVWDKHAAFYLLGGGDPELRTSGASSLLMWESIMRARAMTDIFDFEGSMLKPVERFFRAFGARQTPYLRVSRASRPARAAMAIRSAWHGHVARRSS